MPVTYATVAKKTEVSSDWVSGERRTGGRRTVARPSEIPGHCVADNPAGTMAFSPLPNNREEKVPGDTMVLVSIPGTRMVC